MTPSPRLKILCEYVKWTAFSAVKFPGFPLAGGGATVYPLLAEVAWSEMLEASKGTISCEDFNAWHKWQTEALCDRAKPHHGPALGARPGEAAPSRDGPPRHVGVRAVP